MKFFLVFQNKTYTEERNGGYLWAPQENKSGRKFFHWTNMTKVTKGDVIFSSYKGKLVSISVATSDCLEHEKPSDFDEDELWLKQGWLVNLDYYDLENPINFKDYMDDILPMQADKYAPFDKNGDGNQGYLFEINSDLASYLIALAKTRQLNTDIINYLNKLENDSEEEIILEIDNTIPEDLESTEQESIIKTRVGHGKFKRKLEMFDCQCKICGLKDKELLIASHIKPWRECTDEERLDMHNGFLLCPNHDALFDKGLISFDKEGHILISESIANKTLELLNIHNDIKINVNKKNKKYLNWHRKNIFKEK